MGRVRPASQTGITLIEVMIATMLLMTASLGAVRVLASTAKTTFRSEQSQVAINRAQAELEEIRALPYEQVALTAAPVAAEPPSPTARLASSCSTQGVATDGCFALRDDGANLHPLAVEGGELEEGGTVSGAAVAPGPEPFTTGEVSGTIHRFVVWQNDYACDSVQCPGLQDRKRVSVVVTIDDTASGGTRAYREVQSDFIDPDLGRDTEPTPATPLETTAQELWLTDTTCDQASRVQPEDDHSLHNTLGDCDSLNPPDLLLTSAPEPNQLYPLTDQPLFDYTSDLLDHWGYEEDNPGLELRRESSGSCLYDPGGSNPERFVHRWVTQEVPADSELTLEGRATLDLWTQILGGTSVAAKICVYLFIREQGADGEPIDTMILDASSGGLPYFTYSQQNWPEDGFAPIQMPLHLQPPDGETVIRLLSGMRLGLGISVHAETETPALDLAYEHIELDSRLEIETTTPLP